MDLSAINSSAQVFTSPQNTLPQIRAIHKALHAEIDDRAARLRTQALLLGRLVGKSLSDAGEAIDPQVKTSIESSWNRLLASIETALERVSDTVVDRDDVLKALCAHSLARNAGSREVLGYFLRARGRAMTLAFELDDDERDRGPAAVLDCLGLYTRTLLDVQALVPGKLSDALRGLKKEAIVEDEALLQLESLRLDVAARWCGDEIRYYRPYIRHDDLDGKQAKEMLSSWVEKGGETLLGGLEKTLGQLQDFRSTIELRTQVLQGWIRDGGRVRGLDPATMLDGLRGAVNTRLLEMLATKVHKLRLVGSEVSATLNGWREGSTGTGQSLWEDQGMDLDLSGGAGSFTHNVVSRLYGRNDAVSKAVSCYQSWHRVIDDVGDVVKQLRRQRWDNDVDEVEDEETIEHRQQLLSKDDPQLLHDRLGECLRDAFAELDAELARLWADVEDNSHGHGGEAAVYFIRVLRDMRGRLPDVENAKALGLSLIPALHDRVARTTAQSPLAEFADRALTRRTVAGRGLWEGSDPDLPTSPSPGALGLLRDLVRSMQDSGMDVWSPAAVAVLKAHLRKQLSQAWTEALLRTRPEQGAPGEKTGDSDGPPSSNNHDGDDEKTPDDDDKKPSDDDKKVDGEDEKSSDQGAQAEDASSAAAPAPGQEDAGETHISPETRRDLLVQWVFDISLLRCSIGSPPDSSKDELEDLEEAVYQQSGLESSAAARQRLTRSAQDYWKRTSLLFGLLA
ncbi:hypothetical protein MAPG_00585 [Magnaporthiopsis poae ATCC 64411]|uniref:Conserved oligomeric Golgi complex subunit 1 n=1 Tax=Magnaporthiopsis poae (strain ATCC 64411 / 73-15) TaxID=644358 RepID=A0A0C4DLE4_MAGP6|nr:hypothetical protein MAPG_00585 [Magnaporthiopsis poae ATCC 64411]